MFEVFVFVCFNEVFFLVDVHAFPYLFDLFFVEVVFVKDGCFKFDVGFNLFGMFCLFWVDI